MKKIISILAVLTASLMITAVASAETPVVSIEATPVTAENVANYADYGVELVEGYDAYAIDYKLSGLTLNRSNTPKLAGNILNGFEVVLSMSDEDFEKIYTDYSMMYIANYNTTQTDTFADNNYTTSINTATVAASYPAKNTSVAATDSNAIFTSVVYIPTGETVTMNLYKLSGNVYTFASGNGTEKLKFNIENPAAPVVCDTKTIILGKAAPSFTDATVDFEYKTILGESGVNWTRGILGTVDFKAAENNKFSTIVVTPEKDGVKANKSIEFDVADDVTFENDITVKCALNIKKCADEDTANAITATGSVK